MISKIPPVLSAGFELYSKTLRLNPLPRDAVTIPEINVVKNAQENRDCYC